MVKLHVVFSSKKWFGFILFLLTKLADDKKNQKVMDWENAELHLLIAKPNVYGDNGIITRSSFNQKFSVMPALFLLISSQRELADLRSETTRQPLIYSEEQAGCYKATYQGMIRICMSCSASASECFARWWWLMDWPRFYSSL